MKEYTKRLIMLIDNFLNKSINGDLFEERFREIYDMEDDSVEDEYNHYFMSISQILERFSPFEDDLKNIPDYYIDEETLRNEILKKKVEMNL